MTDTPTPEQPTWLADPLLPNDIVTAAIDDHLKPFFRALSVRLTNEQAIRMGGALAMATKLIEPAVRDWRPILVLFGRPPAYMWGSGAGTNAYFPDQTQDAYGTASGTTIFLDVDKLMTLRSGLDDVATVVVLEELVHTFLNVRDEPLAKVITAHLHGEIITDGTRYSWNDAATWPDDDPDDGE